MKNIILLFVVVSVCFGSALYAEGEGTKKYNLSVCAIFKNEAQYFREWIEYHRLVGVDHFYLYNNGSVDLYEEALKPYIKAGIVSLVEWPDHLNYYQFNEEDDAFLWSLGRQVPAYENAIKLKAVHETKWMVFLDVDEFLVPAGGNFKQIIEKYEECPAVMLRSDFFDSSKIDTLPRRRLLIEAVELTGAPKINPQREVVKALFKPDHCLGFIWPPYQCVFKDNQLARQLKKSEMRINHYVNRYKGYLNFRKRKEILRVDNRMLSEEAVEELLNEGYEIEDQERAIHRFLPRLLTRLGL